MSNLAIQCLSSDCPPFWTVPSGRGFDENSSGKIASDIVVAITQLRDALTISLGQAMSELRYSLNRIYRECSNPNWDGYGAQGISEDTYEEAERIISMLPSSIPAPEIIAEPTGDIGFEWHRGRGMVFALSVSGKHHITYAGIFAGNKAHGFEYFEGVLPFVIRQHLMRLYS